MSYLAVLQLMALSLDPCAAARQAAPAYTVCVPAGQGVALSRSQEEASELADISRDAETRFARYFPTPPGAFAVFFASEAAPVEALKRAGFVSVLPWSSPETIGSLAIEGALQRVTQGDKTIPQEAIDATRAKLPRLIAKIRAEQRDVIAHELGHQWYEALYWSGRPSAAGGYGTVAPDWIEETAAILMEGPVMTDERRASFYRAWSAAGPEGRARPEAIGDLAYLLSRQHPSAGQFARDTGGALVSVGPGTKGGFYDQARMFADYLLDKTGDPLVFHHISTFLAQGGETRRWFAEQQRYPALPRSIAALQSDWSSWTDARAPARKSAG